MHACIDKEPTEWSNRLLIRLKEKDVKAIVSLTVRAISSLFWRKLVKSPFDDDGKFIFIAHKPK